MLPDDVALYPIIPGWNETGDNAAFGVTRKMEWADGKQRLTQGWLRSRVPTQYLSVRARKSPHRLRFEPTGERLSATNELGTRINFVAAVDAAGNVFTGEAIADRATAVLKPSTHPTRCGDCGNWCRRISPRRRPLWTTIETASRARSGAGDDECSSSSSTSNTALERLGDNLQSGAIAALVETGAERRARRAAAVRTSRSPRPAPKSSSASPVPKKKPASTSWSAIGT